MLLVAGILLLLSDTFKERCRYGVGYGKLPDRAHAMQDVGYHFFRSWPRRAALKVLKFLYCVHSLC